jgi:hypothetical protein
MFLVMIAILEWRAVRNTRFYLPWPKHLPVPSIYLPWP